MTLSENIAKYRKQKGYTQEKLGELLGVTNQAVSKWELGISMPDVMLLPKIADVLGTSLNGLYGIEEAAPKKVTADDFPKAANDRLIEYMVEQSGVWFTFNKTKEENINYHKERISGDAVQGCISNVGGAVFVSKDISFIDADYNALNSEYVFENNYITLMLEKLTSDKIRKVLSYLYRESIAHKDGTKGFDVEMITGGCGLSFDDVMFALDALSSMDMLETCIIKNNVREYHFLKAKALFVFAALKMIDRISHDPVFLVCRDTSTQADYCFEKLWK